MADPIPFPSIRVTNAVFVPVQRRDIARMEGRHTETEDDPEAYWRASFNLVPKRNAEIGAILAFLNYRGLFLAHHPLRPKPAAYLSSPMPDTKAIGGAFTGNNGDVNSLADRLAPGIAELPDGFVLTAGDTVGFVMSAKVRSLHMLAAPVTANGSGVATLSLTTPVPTDITDLAEVHFIKASIPMRITNQSTPITPGSSVYSFRAEEVFEQ